MTFGAMPSFNAFLIGMHRATVRLHRLLHLHAAFGTFIADFAGTLLMHGAAAHGGLGFFGQLHVTFGTFVAFFRLTHDEGKGWVDRPGP